MNSSTSVAPSNCSLNIRNPLQQLLHVVHDGALVDADGSVFIERFDDQRKIQLVGPFDFAFLKRAEPRVADVVELKDLLAQRFVAGQAASRPTRSR